MNRGFSLIEIIVSIAIMALLTAVALPQLRRPNGPAEEQGRVVADLTAALRDVQARAVNGGLLATTSEVPTGYQLRIVDARTYVLEAILTSGAVAVSTRTWAMTTVSPIGWRFFVPMYERDWQIYDQADGSITDVVVTLTVGSPPTDQVIAVDQVTNQVFIP